MSWIFGNFENVSCDKEFWNFLWNFLGPDFWMFQFELLRIEVFETMKLICRLESEYFMVS